MTLNDTAEKIADNVFLVALGRIALLAIVPVIGAFYFLVTDRVDTRIGSVESRVTPLELHDQITLQRLSVLETNDVRGRADREQFQTEARATLQKIQEQQTAMLQVLATLTARLDSLVTGRR